MTTKHLIHIAACAALLVLLASCTVPVPPHTAPAVPTASPELVALTPLKVSVAPFLSYAPFYIALEEGYFAEQGVEIELVRVARAVDAIPALAQGEIDVAGINVSSALLNALVRGSGIRIVASMAQEIQGKCASNGLVLRQGLSLEPEAPIPSATLRSMRFYVNPVSTLGYAMDTWLGQQGLTLEDVTLVELTGGATILEPLAQGAVDMAWQTEPWITRAQDAGAGELWLPLANVLPQVQNSVITFGPSVLRDNPAAGERFVTAYLEGARQYAEGKTERNLEILEKYMELDRALLEKMCFPSVPADGAILAQSVAEFSQWAADRDYIDQPLTPQMFWEPRFVEQANAALEAR